MLPCGVAYPVLNQSLSLYPSKIRTEGLLGRVPAEVVEPGVVLAEGPLDEFDPAAFQQRSSARVQNPELLVFVPPVEWITFWRRLRYTRLRKTRRRDRRYGLPDP